MGPTYSQSPVHPVRSKPTKRSPSFVASTAVDRELFHRFHQVSLIAKGILEADSGRRYGKSWRALSLQRSGADSMTLRLQIGTPSHPVERRPAYAGQACNFARRRNVLRAQWSKREHHARQSLYVPLPVSTALEWSRTAAESETFWKLLVNLAAYAPEVETFWKLLGNLSRPGRPAIQMVDTRSILSAGLRQWHCDRKAPMSVTVRQTFPLCSTTRISLPLDESAGFPD